MAIDEVNATHLMMGNETVAFVLDSVDDQRDSRAERNEISPSRDTSNQTTKHFPFIVFVISAAGILVDFITPICCAATIFADLFFGSHS